MVMYNNDLRYQYGLVPCRILTADSVLEIDNIFP